MFTEPDQISKFLLYYENSAASIEDLLDVGFLMWYSESRFRLLSTKIFFRVNCESTLTNEDA